MCRKGTLWQKTAILLLLIVYPQTVDARTWRPMGQPAIKGEFADVVGMNVTIRTDDGIQSVPYANLSPTDKAFVKSNLQSKGRINEAAQLDGAAGSSGSKPFMGLIPPGEIAQTETGGMVRTWTDLAGNRLIAEFVGTKGTDVFLRIGGVTKGYPIKAFSAADQEWIAENRSADLPDSQFGEMTPNPGMSPGSATGGGYQPPAMPRIPDFRPPTFTPPNLPSPGSGGYPGGSFPGGHTAESPYGPGTSLPGSHSATGSSSPDFGSQPPRYGGPPNYGGSTQGLFETEYKCSQCGATFPENSGLKSGDPCPKCSARSTGFSNSDSSPTESTSSGPSSFRISRGIVKGAVALIFFCVSAVSWFIRKLVNS